MSFRIKAVLIAIAFLVVTTFAYFSFSRADDIGEVSTTFKLIGPNDKLVTSAFDDPKVQGVSCYLTLPKVGGVKGGLGLAEQVSDASIACVQTGPIIFLKPMKQQERVYEESRSILFKTLNVTRMWDAARKTLVYVTNTDKVIEGSPKNATSVVVVRPWDSTAVAVPEIK